MGRYLQSSAAARRRRLALCTRSSEILIPATDITFAIGARRVSADPTNLFNALNRTVGNLVLGGNAR